MSELPDWKHPLSVAPHPIYAGPIVILDAEQSVVCETTDRVLAETLCAALRRVSELERDAERYRWLRDGNTRKSGNYAALDIASDKYGNEWDELIDAALSAKAVSDKRKEG